VSETAPGITVQLPDGTARTLPLGSTVADLAASIGRRLARDAVAAQLDGEFVDLSHPLADGDKVRVITADSDEGREVLRHSTAHVLAQAVLTLWPGARYAIGPAIKDGFYYDFELPDGARFSEDDLARIDAQMRAIIAEAQPFIREEHSFDEGLALFADQPFKQEIIEGVRTRAADLDPELAAETSDSGGVSVYRNDGHFIDLCRGPHVPSTDRLGHFRLTRVAGAYWRGDEHRQQLQRVYGSAFESEAALEAHFHFLAEAERRDHRRLGLELDLFSFPEEIGPGLAVFHPKGGLIRKLLEDYSRQRHEEAGYQFVNTPHITKADLFVTSGHLQWYAEGMYPPMELDEGQQYYLKPMNCPFHILIYRSRQRSYRELPMRLFEFGTVYRYEKSGVLHGLTRMRGFAQDDAHIFATPETLRDELTSLLEFVLQLLRDYGLNDFYLELSTRPTHKVVGTEAEWDEATELLREIASAMDLELVLDPGGGAFYGPKISVQARDAIGRSWQMSTVQLDFQLPALFDLGYIGSDNTRHRPIMIHRALFGSVERFFAVLLEHYAGAFPTWLSPTQVVVLGVSEDHDAYATEVTRHLAAVGVRTEHDPATENLGARIRRAKLSHVPYILVVGASDVEAETVGVNARGSDKPIRDVPLAQFTTSVLDEIAERRSPEPVGAASAPT
jgi:threonyl-tRNA synthetase